MNRWGDVQGALQRVFGIIWDLTVLNICFLVSCLPLFTIGASVTAMYSVNLRRIRGEEGRVAGDFFRDFRKNFWQSTKCFFLLMAAGCLFALEFGLLSELKGVVSVIVAIPLGGLFVVYLAVCQYIFAYLGRFSDNLITSLKNALILSGNNMLHTFSLLSMAFLCVFVSCYSLPIFLRAIYVWLVLGFAALNYLQSLLLHRVFVPYV